MTGTRETRTRRGRKKTGTKQGYSRLRGPGKRHERVRAVIRSLSRCAGQLSARRLLFQSPSLLFQCAQRELDLGEQ